MVEITNKTHSPVSLIVRSRRGPKQFTTLRICGIGAKNNVVCLPDEKMTEYIDRIEKAGLISTRRIPNNELTKGE